MSDENSQALWYDRQAYKFAAYAICHQFNTPAFERDIRVYLGFLGMPTGSRILEVGAGVGQFTVPLQKHGYPVVAVDISLGSLRCLRTVASQFSQQSHVVCSNVFNLPFRSAFDAAFCVNLLHHVSDPVRAIKEISECVKPGGRVVFIEPNVLNPFQCVFTLLRLDWRVEQGFWRSTEWNLRRWFHQAGLNTVQLGRHGLLPGWLGNRLPVIFQANDFAVQLPVMRWFCSILLVRGNRSGVLERV